MSVTATLLMTCPDRKGVVAAISNFVYSNQGNIVDAEQHIDEDEGLFLQRVEWDLEGFRLKREEILPALKPLTDEYGMTTSLRFSDAVPRMALLASREPHCLYDILSRWRAGEFRVEVPLVIANHEKMREVADCFDVPFHCLPVRPGEKAAQEKEVVRLLESNRIELVVLARYMQILSEDVVSRFPFRMINIHHSFLPAFPGERPYHRAHQRGVKLIGATAHYVTASLDDGPIIEQDVVRVSHRDPVARLRAKGRDLERVVLARAIDLHLRNRILVFGNKTVVF